MCNLPTLEAATQVLKLRRPGWDGMGRRERTETTISKAVVVVVVV